MLWESITRWSGMMRKGFLKEITLELQLCRLSRCSIGEGKIEVGGDMQVEGACVRTEMPGKMVMLLRSSAWVGAE